MSTHTRLLFWKWKLWSCREALRYNASEAEAYAAGENDMFEAADQWETKAGRIIP